MRQLRLNVPAVELRSCAPSNTNSNKDRSTIMERAEVDMAKGEHESRLNIRYMTQTQVDNGEFSAFGHVSQYFQPYVLYWKIETMEGKAGLFMIFWDLHACFATDDGAVTWGKWIKREEGLLIANNLFIDAFNGQEFVPVLDGNLKPMNIKLDPKYRLRIPTLAEDAMAWFPIKATAFMAQQARDSPGRAALKIALRVVSPRRVEGG
jgi:hypothetical protein